LLVAKSDVGRGKSVVRGQTQVLAVEALLGFQLGLVEPGPAALAQLKIASVGLVGNEFADRFGVLALVQRLDGVKLNKG
jgi:hypothetical protein